MEPKSLEHLLDCPICFERLDGSNRVLPCQHTFCKQCLGRIKSKFKELRCPECRKEYSGYIDELPCNILVMRILEQIKQSEKEAQKLKNSDKIKHSSGKTEVKTLFSNNDKRNHLNNNEGSSATLNDNMLESVARSHSAISSFLPRNRTNNVRTGTGTMIHEVSSNNATLSLPDRLILGAIRKQTRNRDDGSRMPSIFVRSTVSSYAPNIDERVTLDHERFTFSPNAYTFSVDLKSSDHNSSTVKRSNKNYVKPPILNAMSNQNVFRRSTNIIDTNTVTNLNPITPSTSQSILFSQNSPKNYLSFSPNCYTFNVNLTPDRSRYQRKNYLS